MIPDDPTEEDVKLALTQIPMWPVDLGTPLEVEFTQHPIERLGCDGFAFGYLLRPAHVRAVFQAVPQRALHYGLADFTLPGRTVRMCLERIRWQMETKTFEVEGTVIE